VPVDVDGQHILQHLARPHRVAGQPDRLATGPPDEVNSVETHRRDIKGRQRRVEPWRRGIEPLGNITPCSLHAGHC
jgi:hypothetical protein